MATSRSVAVTGAPYADKRISAPVRGAQGCRVPRPRPGFSLYFLLHAPPPARFRSPGRARLRTPPTWSSSPRPTCTATPPPGTTTGTRPFAGGLVRAATVVDSLRRRYPAHVVLVDAGDLIQGNPFAAYFARVAPRDPNPMVDVMGAMGYDAATPGNHEFNFGVPFMLRALGGAAFPFVSGNIYALPRDTLALPPVCRGAAGRRAGGDHRLHHARRHGLGRGQRAEPPAGGADRPGRRPGAGGAGSVSPTSWSPWSTAAWTSRRPMIPPGVGPENDAAVAGPPAGEAGARRGAGHTHREMTDSVHQRCPFRPAAGTGRMSLAVVHVYLVHERPGLAAGVRPCRDRPPGPGAAAGVDRPPAGAAGPGGAGMGGPAARARPGPPCRPRRRGSEVTPIVNFINEVERRRTGADLAVHAGLRHLCRVHRGRYHRGPGRRPLSL